MNVRRMLALLAGSVGARIVGALIGLSTQIILARLLHPADVGTVFLTMSMAAILSLFVISGYPSLVMTELPRLAFWGRKRAIAAMHATALWDWALITVAMAVMALLVIVLFPVSDSMRLAIIFGLLSTPGSAMIRYSSAIANSFKLFAVTFIPDNIIRPGAFLVVILVCLALRIHPPVYALLWAYILANLFAAIVQAPFLGDLGLRLWHAQFWRRRLTRVLRSRAYAIALVAAVATSFADIITLLGGFFLPADDVAILGVTVRLAAIAGFVVQSAQQFILPDLTVAMAARETDKVNKVLFRLNLTTIAIVIAGLVFTVLFGRLVLGIFGPAYAEGYLLLVLLMIAQSVRALSGMNQSLLSIGGFQLRTAGSCIMAVVVLAVTWMLLYPHVGMTGIGLAVIVTELFWGFLLAVQAQRLTGRRGDFLALVFGDT